MLVEILLVIGIAAAIFFAVRYIVLQHKRHGCVGCSECSRCNHRWKNCVKAKNKDRDHSDS